MFRLSSVVLLALAAPAVLAQTQTWASWSSSSPSAASGTVGTIATTLTVNPATNPGLSMGNSVNQNQAKWNNVTNYGPNPPTTASDISFLYIRGAAPGPKADVTMTFAKWLFDPMIRIYNLDASQIQMGTTPSTLLYTNGQLAKQGERYYDIDGEGYIASDLNTGGAGTIAFSGIYKQLNWVGEWNPNSPNAGDGYGLTVSGVVPTTCDFFKLPAKQPKPRRIRPGRNFKLTLTLTSTLKETLPEMDVFMTLPAGVTYVNAKSKFVHERATVVGNTVAVKLNQVRGAAKLFLTLAASNAVTGTLSFPYVVAVPNKYCILEQTSQVTVITPKK